MPWTVNNVPDAASKLPKEAKKIFCEAANPVMEKDDDEGKAVRIGMTAVKNAGYEKDKDGEWSKVEKSTYSGSYQDLMNKVDHAVRENKTSFCQCSALKDWSSPYPEATYDGQVLVKCYECGGLWMADWSENDQGEIELNDIKEAKNIIVVNDGSVVKSGRKISGKHRTMLQQMKDYIDGLIHADDKGDKGSKGDKGKTEGNNDDGVEKAEIDLFTMVTLAKEAGQDWLLWSEEGKAPVLLDLRKFDGNGKVKKEDTIGDKLFTIPITKADTEKKLLYGLVYEPDAEDTQGDKMTAEEIEKTAHTYLTKFRLINKQHKVDIDADVVESYIAPMDFTLNNQTVKKGSWILVTRVNDESVWKDIKKGKLTGYSMEGYGRREKVVA